MENSFIYFFRDILESLDIRIERVITNNINGSYLVMCNTPLRFTIAVTNVKLMKLTYRIEMMPSNITGRHFLRDRDHESLEFCYDAGIDNDIVNKLKRDLIIRVIYLLDNYT